MTAPEARLAIHASLLASLVRLASLQNEVVDRVALQEASHAALTNADASGAVQLTLLTQHLQIAPAQWLATADAAAVPALLHTRSGEHAGLWGVLRGTNGRDQWVCEWWDSSAQVWHETLHDALVDYGIATLKLRPTLLAHASPVYQLIRKEVWSHRSVLRDTLIGGLMINVVALAASFYSMQVYDRVIPSGSSQTLLVLTLGVMAATLFEFIAKRTRTHLYERLIEAVDQRLARTVYLRFLSIRLDQLPQSVGSLAGQLRGFETVRNFFTSVTTNLMVDAPFAVFFSLIIASISGSLALIPLVFFLLSLSIGFFSRRQYEAFANQSVAASNHKTGLLVESIEGAEAIKSGQGGWRMLSRWMRTTDDARACELHMRRISDHAQHLTAAFQQLSYVLLVAWGALLVSKGELTMGSLIACSILSGRVLAPVALIPSQLVLWAQTKAALQGLDKIWALQDDHHGQAQPVVVEHIAGNYRVESTKMYYHGANALSIDKLHIRAAEKVGVLGPVGAGKTTLLRLLSGMYKPQEGRILLDDVDLAHISKPCLAEHVGYVQQDGRLFAGTLRDNLILGQIDPGDDAILSIARQTGLLQAVISTHPKGLQQEIFEGGAGLSGGQRQLVNLTRAFLRKPCIWLLDEPTASMDRNLEQQVTEALSHAIAPSNTLVLVTHKAEMLSLVDRIIVIANHQVVLDGPRDAVLQQLKGGGT